MLNDSQLLTIALATVPTLIVVAIGILINNHRLNDMGNRFNDMTNRFADLKETLRAEIKAGDAAILSQVGTYHVDIISKLAELDNRITRLER